MPPRKAYKKRPVRRRPAPRRMRMPRRYASSGVPDVASLSEGYTGTQNSTVFGGVATSYNGLTLAGSPFKRAQAVGQNYQFFRIKRVTYTIKPTFDTFIPGGQTIPYVYWSINKTGESLVLNQANLESRGAKPIRLDDKNIVISYRPTVGMLNEATNPLTNNAGSYKTSPWLNTDNLTNSAAWSPSTVQHFGHYMMITLAGNTIQFDVQVMVEFEFKKPRVQTNQSMESPPEFFDSIVNLED